MGYLYPIEYHLTVLQAGESELQCHYQRLTEIKQQGGGLWPEALIENEWRGVSR